MRAIRKSEQSTLDAVNAYIKGGMEYPEAMYKAWNQEIKGSLMDYSRLVELYDAQFDNYIY